MRLLALISLATMVASAALAWLPPPVPCADVANNPDGSRTARKPMKLQDRRSSVTLAPGDLITPGHPVNGMLVAEDLSRRCQAR